MYLPLISKCCGRNLDIKRMKVTSNCDAANMLVKVRQPRLVQLVCHAYAALCNERLVLHNKECDNFYSSPNAVRHVERDDHIPYMGKMRS
jgi:hypothetical protein